MRMTDLIKKTLPAVILIAAFAIAVHYVYFIFPFYSKKAEVVMTIEHGTPVSQIADELKRDEVIDNPTLFKAIARARGADRKLKAGRYRFEKNQSEAATVSMLVRGSTLAERVTIPEGLTLRQIASILSREASIDSSRFISLATDRALIESLGIKTGTLEGYLFPDTYNIFWRMHPERVIKMMVARLFEVFNDDHREQATRIGYTIHQILIMASMVEREAKLPEERALIAGVLYNRIKIDMPLQCDATVQYALAEYKEVLVYADLNVNSRYNTYLYYGLPPGPIGNPGAGSILGALYPEETNYLYYVAKGDGSHIFSRTKQEHARAKVEARLSRQSTRRE